MANLKTFQFEDNDLSAMKQQMQKQDLSDKNRWHLHFALGKAYEDAKAYEESFRHYADGNALYLQGHSYDADFITTRTERLMEGFRPRILSGTQWSGLPGSRSDFHPRHAASRFNVT